MSRSCVCLKNEKTMSQKKKVCHDRKILEISNNCENGSGPDEPASTDPTAPS